jgi:hypothetical protein
MGTESLARDIDFTEALHAATPQKTCFLGTPAIKRTHEEHSY